MRFKARLTRDAEAVLERLFDVVLERDLADQAQRLADAVDIGRHARTGRLIEWRIEGRIERAREQCAGGSNAPVWP